MSRISSIGDPHNSIWIVGDNCDGEASAKNRSIAGKPAEILESVLSSVGLSSSECYITNLYNYYCTNFSTLIHTTGKGKKKIHQHESLLTDEIIQLYTDIDKYNPKLIIALGHYPLDILTGKIGIGSWRGSPLTCINHPDIIVLATYHPRYIVANRNEYPIFISDIDKAFKLSKSYMPHQFDIKVGPEVSESIVEEYLNAPMLAVDIETVKNSTTILCVGFAKSEYDAISIPLDGSFTNLDWITRLLNSPSRKLFHFGSFDTTQLKLNNLTTNNYSDDTIVMAHILNPELPRSLAFLTSMYTNIPYYKQEGINTIPSDEKAWNPKRSLHDLMVYNGKDVCATFACYNSMLPDILSDEAFKRYYDYEIDLLKPCLNISDNGLLIDPVRKGQLHEAVTDKINKAQNFLNRLTLYENFNVNSPINMKYMLYEHFKLPVKTKHDKAKGESKVTTNNDALISLAGYCKDKINTLKTDKSKLEWQIKLQFVLNCMIVREYRKLLSSYIDIESNDGYIKGLYNVVGTETGRLSASKYVDGSGFGPQTTPRGSVDYNEHQ